MYTVIILINALHCGDKPERGYVLQQKPQHLIVHWYHRIDTDCYAGLLFQSCHIIHIVLGRLHTVSFLAMPYTVIELCMANKVTLGFVVSASLCFWYASIRLLQYCVVVRYPRLAAVTGLPLHFVATELLYSCVATKCMLYNFWVCCYFNTDNNSSAFRAQVIVIASAVRKLRLAEKRKEEAWVKKKKK